MELPTSELKLELNCLRDFVLESELNWKLELLLPELELNCKTGIDPGSDLVFGNTFNRECALQE